VKTDWSGYLHKAIKEGLTRASQKLDKIQAMPTMTLVEWLGGGDR